MFASRILVVFAVFSLSTVLQGCSCGWRPCLFKQAAKKKKSKATEAPTAEKMEVQEEEQEEAAMQEEEEEEVGPERPPNGNGAEDVAIYIYNHHKHAFTLFTSRPETGTWVNRGPPIPEDDWMIDDTIQFDESTVVKHGGLAKQASKGTMTLTFPSGATCKLEYGHDGNTKATATSDCGHKGDLHISQVVHTAVDEGTGMSLIFEVNGAPSRSKTMLLFTDAAAEVKRIDWMLLKATWKGGGVFGLLSLMVLARRRVATPTAEPAVELEARC